MRASTYRARQLGRGLRNGTARIVGRCAHPGPWGDPTSPVYWIVEDLNAQETYHVPEHARPTWRRYAPPEAQA
jgi:hypothetical protein